MPLADINDMCGRFLQFSDASAVAAAFDLTALEVPDLGPNYNVAPTQTILAVRVEGGRRRAIPLRWGLIPSWAKDAKIGSSLINARADTAATKPSFRSAFKSRRCLVPADGFYEWQGAGTRHKRPFLFRPSSGRPPLALAGLWERWHGPDGESLETCCVLTTEANAVVSPVHDRMPVVVGPGDYDGWLLAGDVGLLRPCPDDWLATHEVSPIVNSPKNNSPECLRPVA